MAVEKTVFISYRRTNIFVARAVFQDLRANGYDVFMDYESINAGAFDQIIVNQVKARAHFVVILTPSALERCSDPNDWLRREIETAIDYKRNIIPLVFEGFAWKDVDKYLTGKLSVLNVYNSLNIPADYFDEAMMRLRTRFLNIDVQTVIHPTPKADEKAVAKVIENAVNQPTVTTDQLSASEYFESAYQKHENGDYEGATADYSKALSLNPSDHLAWYNRGLGYYMMENHPQAISDYSEALRLKPDYINAYYNRGLARNKNKDRAGALADYNETIRRKPDYTNAFRARGIIYEDMGEYDSAIADYSRYVELGGTEPEKVRGWIDEVRLKRERANASGGSGMTALQYFDRAYQKHENGDYAGAVADYSESLRLNPKDHLAWYNRGLGYYNQNQHDQAISDYSECIRLDPTYINAYYNRGLARNKNGDYTGALADYAETIRRKPDYINAYFARGILYEDTGEYAKAKADYERYLELGGPNSDKIRGWISDVEAKMRGS